MEAGWVAKIKGLFATFLGFLYCRLIMSAFVNPAYAYLTPRRIIGA